MHDIRLATVKDIEVIARHRVRMFEDMGTLPPDQVPTMVERTCRYLERAIPGVADVIAVCMRQQHDVNRTQTRIARAGHGLAGIVENAHARRILEDHRPVECAKFARV